MKTPLGHFRQAPVMIVLGKNWRWARTHRWTWCRIRCWRRWQITQCNWWCNWWLCLLLQTCPWYRNWITSTTRRPGRRNTIEKLILISRPWKKRSRGQRRTNWRDITKRRRFYILWWISFDLQHIILHYLSNKCMLQKYVIRIRIN